MLSLHREDLEIEFSLVDSGAEVLGAERSAEDGRMDGAACGSPRAGGDRDRVESSAMISLLSLLHK